MKYLGVQSQIALLLSILKIWVEQKRVHCLKITQNVALSFFFFLILAFSNNVCPIKIDLSGNNI